MFFIQDKGGLEKMEEDDYTPFEKGDKVKWNIPKIENFGWWPETLKKMGDNIMTVESVLPDQTVSKARHPQILTVEGCPDKFCGIFFIKA